MNVKNPLVTLIMMAVLLMPSLLWGAENAYYAKQLKAVAKAEGMTVQSPVQATDGYVWFVSERGIARFDGYRIAHLPYPDSLWQDIHEADTLMLCPDGENHLLWIHSDKGLIGGMEQFNGTFIDAPATAYKDFGKCHHGKVYHWLYGSAKGCCRIRYTNGNFEVEKYPYTIRQIETDEGGNDWILTDEGLFRNGFDKGLPSSKGIECIALYRGICIGINQERLLIYNRSRQIVRNTPLPTQYQGLATGTKLQIQGEDLWIHTAASTYSYQMVDDIFTIHPSANTIRIKTDSISLNKPYSGKPTETVVSQMKVDGETFISPYEWEKLPASPDSIEIGVTNFAFLPQGEWFYQFFLEGVDKEWSTPTTTAKAVYKELPAGSYRIHVRSASDNYLWGTESVYTFSIATPWWHNPIKWLITILLTGAGIKLWYHRNRLRTASQENGKADETREETTSSQNSIPSTEKRNQQKIIAPWHNLKVEEVQRMTEEEKKKPSSLRDERFKRMLEESISKHITDPDFMVDHLATQMQMGRTRFYTRTKEVMGCSPAELLRYRRLEHAAELLRKTDLTIDKVREICCFSNSTNFYNAFKQRFGVTPHQYRCSSKEGV